MYENANLHTIIRQINPCAYQTTHECLKPARNPKKAYYVGLITKNEMQRRPKTLRIKKDCKLNTRPIEFTTGKLIKALSDQVGFIFCVYVFGS